QVGNDVFGDSVAEVLLFGVAAHVCERQHGNRGPLLMVGPRTYHASCRSRVHVFQRNAVDTDWLVDVFQLLVTQVLESEIKPITDLVANDMRNGDTTRFGDALQSRRYVNTVAEDIVALNNHVANVDADAE